MLAVEGLLVGATGWACHPLPIVRAWSPRRPGRGQHQEQKLQQRAEFKAIRRRRAPPAAMTATGGGGGGGGGCGSGDGPSKKYNKDAWQRRASRAMKYVSMPIVKKAGQPREQVRKMGAHSSTQQQALFHSSRRERGLRPRSRVRRKGAGMHVRQI